MRKCSSCQFENKDEAKFCVKCGTSFENGEIIPNANKSSIFRQPWFWIVLVIAVTLFGLYQSGVIGPDKTTYLVASNSKVVFLKPGGTADITIDTDGKRWKITHSPDWCAVEKSEAGVMITCGKNYTSESREGWITVVSGDYNLQISLAQYGQATYLKLSETNLKSDEDGGTIKVEVDTDGDDWTVEYPKFLDIETGANDFTITCPSNSGISRTGYIKVSLETLSQSIYLYQEGKCAICQGSGSQRCYMCNATGKVMSSVDWYGNWTYTQCGYCGGDGQIQCNTCNGTGIK